MPDVGNTYSPPSGGGSGDILEIGPDAFPQSGSSSKSRSSAYTGPAPWALDTYKALLGFAPDMVEAWKPAWEDFQKVPGLLEEQRTLIPQRTLANMGDYEDWRRPIRNMYAARGMLDSTPAAAARSDLDKALFREYSRANLEGDMGINQMLAEHYATKAALAGQNVDTAANLAGLGRISTSQSAAEASSYAKDPSRRYQLILDAIGL